MSTETNADIIIDAEYSGKRLDIVAQASLPAYSREQIKKWILSGEITINHLQKKPSDKVSIGQALNIHIKAQEAELSLKAQNIALNLVYEDDHLAIINKPAGFIVHPGNGHADGTLMNALLYHYPDSVHLPRAGIVHRLDKETSGLLVVAKTLASYTDLVRQLKDKEVTRIYHALVFGHIATAGIVNAPIGRHRIDRVKMAVTDSGKPAITHYRPIAYYAYPDRPTRFTLLECRLETGRTHQIRVHMQSIGHPIVGDPTYGLRRKVMIAPVDEFNRQALHAKELALQSLSGERLHETAALPEDFALLLASLEQEAKTVSTCE